MIPSGVASSFGKKLVQEQLSLADSSFKKIGVFKKIQSRHQSLSFFDSTDH